MAGITKKVTLVSITPGAKSDMLKVTLALDEDEITFSAHVDKVHIAEDESFNLIRFDLVFDHFFYRNKHIVRHVTKAVDDFCASKPISFPVDLGYYNTVGAMPIDDI